jgi:hypothetical protein
LDVAAAERLGFPLTSVGEAKESLSMLPEGPLSSNSCAAVLIPESQTGLVVVQDVDAPMSVIQQQTRIVLPGLGAAEVGGAASSRPAPDIADEAMVIWGANGAQAWARSGTRVINVVITLAASTYESRGVTAAQIGTLAEQQMRAVAVGSGLG